MSNIPVFLASDDNYAPFVATTIASICDNTKSFIEFYILDGGISNINKSKIAYLINQFNNFSIEFIKLDLDREFPDFKETDRISKSMYSRFLIPTLKPNLNKVIYSDVDVIFLDDISKMYNESLDDHALGAVWEEYSEKINNDSHKKRLELSNFHKYFSSGNLIIDSNKWLDNSILEKLIKISTDSIDILSCPDQDVLNKFFNNNYKVLNQKYCYINQNFIFYEDHNDIVIRHYNGKIKPWHVAPGSDSSLMPNLEDFWYYAKKTDFYEELYIKTQNKEEQVLLLRQLKVSSIMLKAKLKSKV